MTSSESLLCRVNPPTCVLPRIPFSSIPSSKPMTTGQVSQYTDPQISKYLNLTEVLTVDTSGMCPIKLGISNIWVWGTKEFANKLDIFSFSFYTR